MGMVMQKANERCFYGFLYKHLALALSLLTIYSYAEAVN